MKKSSSIAASGALDKVAALAQNFVPVSCLSLLLLAGCNTTKHMKGTPFMSGEYTGSKGLPEDRVNLWPLLYYNNPALSILWPLGEHTDTSLAFRPLFSLYRDRPGKPYAEFNLLYPFSHFSLDGYNRNHVFPFFWGDGYFIAFPFYWQYDNFNALFPLCIYNWE
ncbi:MAG: hypothetical protein FWF96_01895, partial [Kiritimatiellaeota bacterium]|nr:hypothetical protein [Kiritimatiellota bacterium]